MLNLNVNVKSKCKYKCLENIQIAHACQHAQTHPYPWPTVLWMRRQKEEGPNMAGSLQLGDIEQVVMEVVHAALQGALPPVLSTLLTVSYLAKSWTFYCILGEAIVS